MNITEIRNKIEDNLNQFLPEAVNSLWTNAAFGNIPEAVKENHISQLLTPCRSLMSLGGKRWRPLLQVLVAKLVSKDKNAGDVETAFKLTPLVEFVHTASLIHDDIEDAADTRRGKPAAHITYGLDTALNAGAWLYFTAPAAIDTLNLPEEKKNLFYSLFMMELRRLHLGQAMDIFWHRNPDIFPSKEEYQSMVQNKTGTLSCLAVLTGVLCGGGSKEEALTAGDIARGIGEGFQILDDVQNLTTGNPGKKRGDDIVEGKKSLPVLMHIEEYPEDKDIIASCFINARKEGIMSESVEKCISILEKGGCIKKAFEKGHSLVREKSLQLVKMFEKNSELSENAKAIVDLFESMLPEV
ncbi:MAG: polyprenyl synthetase family protein [Treponema sp.]|nr:polyprenyl synthetase family protein [Candidatus Treponema merdequi]